MHPRVIRLPVRITPDSSRVITRFFSPGDLRSVARHHRTRTGVSRAAKSRAAWPSSSGFRRQPS